MNTNLRLTALALLGCAAVGAQANAWIMGFSGGQTNYLDLTMSDNSVVTVDTNTSNFDSGRNQGWWNGTSYTNSFSNDNTFAGEASGYYLRDFFTFDLSSLNGTVASASLRLGSTFDINASDFFTLWDVSTDARTLNYTQGTDAGIFNDLGSGSQYGSVYVTPSNSYTTNFAIGLNGTAVADINASAGGFFSIGGRFDPVPEPASIAVLGLGALALIRRKR